MKIPIKKLSVGVFALLLAATVMAPSYNDSAAAAVSRVESESDALPVEEAPESDDGVVPAEQDQEDAGSNSEDGGDPAPLSEDASGEGEPSGISPEQDGAMSGESGAASSYDGGFVAELAAPAQASCLNSKNELIGGCARVGSFNLGHADYSPGVRMCTEARFNAKECPKKDFYFRTDSMKTGLYDYGNASGVLMEKCAQFTGGVQNCLKKGYWPLRKAHIMTIIKEANVDIVNLQEITDDPVWLKWPSSGTPEESTYRKEVASMMKGLGFAKAQLTNADREKICPGYTNLAADKKKCSAERAEIYYRTSQYELMPNGTFISIERDLMKGTEQQNKLRPMTSVGQVFVSAKLQRKGFTTASNKLVVTNVHLPTQESFSNKTKEGTEEVVTIGTAPNAITYTTAYGKATAYQRELSKRIARDTGLRACSATCLSPSVDKPYIPIMITGDFNAVYQNTTAKNPADNEIPTAPYGLIHHTGYKFQGPDYTLPPKGSDLSGFGTNLPSEWIMTKGVVIDHALLKIPAENLVISNYSVTPMRLHTSSSATNLKDYLASDHRMIVAHYKLTWVP